MNTISRRAFVTSASALGLVGASGLAMPYYSRANQRPGFTHGVQSGDVDTKSGMIWTRADRPSRIMVEVSTTESFAKAPRLSPLDALPGSDFTVKRAARRAAVRPGHLLPLHRRRSLRHQHRFRADRRPLPHRTASRRAVRFAWSGDTAGQGWGIDDVGMKTYSTIASTRRTSSSIPATRSMPTTRCPTRSTCSGTAAIWKNRRLIDEKRKVAGTLDEYRGQWKYNMIDEHVRAMNAICPTFYQWDDHEVLNNWSAFEGPERRPRYSGKDRSVCCAARAMRALSRDDADPRDAGRARPRLSARSPMGGCSTCSSSTCAPIAAPNGPDMQDAMTPQSRMLGGSRPNG